MAFITTSKLSVEFAIFGANSRSLKNTIISQATGGRVMTGARNIVSVQAIDQLDLDIRDGDRVGLVGHNGSGKTTLLRVLAGIFHPTSGRISMQGRVGALLDTSSGMDDEATGIQNIYFRGYLLGMNKREIASKIDDIAEFTELGSFLHLPVKTYSAGMRARLTFGIATSVDNDILLIDEGIGAGDESFQQKARERIEGLFARTSIILLASHSKDLIENYCNRVVRMEHGRKVDDRQTVQKPLEEVARGDEAAVS